MGRAAAKLTSITGTADPQVLTITPPNMMTVALKVRGAAPYVQNKFGAGAAGKIREGQAEGSTTTKKKTREPKDFEKLYRESMHVSDEGWYGIPAVAFRNAMIDACRLVNFKMNYAKLSVGVDADGYGKDGQALVKITKGEPKHFEAMAVNKNGGTDIRVRGMWMPGWEATVRVTFDRGQFTAEDVLNLLARAGTQVGIGAGRPYSKNSGGCGWGLFAVVKGKQE